ncbi:alpha/beta fold hydrolase [Bacillaceae bacterium Marseille-Q3522]|nr:alpha/beta fold hydrolase [Bacillaceae bacterium Marseille-Q3522]
MENQVLIRWNEINLAATVCYPPQQAEKYPVLLICHGFIGSRIGVDRLFVKTARDLTKLQNCLVIRFDYAGCGESEGKYGDNYFADFISQTKAVLEFALSLEKADSGNVTVIGHSLGGAVALLTAARDPRIHHLILWSAVAYPFEDIVHVVGIKTYEQLEHLPEVDHHGFLLKRHFFQSLAAYHPISALQHFNGDVLVLHGSNDEEIPVEYGLQYNDAFKSRRTGTCRMGIILDADHTFSSAAAYKQLIAATNQWLLDIKKQPVNEKSD